MHRLLISLYICLLTLSSTAQNRYFDSLNKALVHTAKPIDRFDLLNKIREEFVLNQENNYDTSEAIEMLRIAQQLHSDSLLAISYNVIGNLIQAGDATGSMEYYFKALPLAERSHDKRRISSIYLDIAFTYYTLKNYEEGLKYTKSGGENLPDRQSPMYNLMAIQYNRNMVRYFLNENQPDSALRYLHEMEDLNRGLNSMSFKTGAFALNGRAYAQLGDMEMADLYFRKANSLADSTNHDALKITGRQNYIPFLLGAKRIAEAKQLAIELLGLSNSKSTITLAAAGYLRRIYDTLHIPDSAYYYSRMELSVRDSIFSQENAAKLQSLAFNDKIRTMEEANRLADESRQRRENIQYALLSLGIVCFIIIFLLLSRSFITNTKLIEFLGVIALLIVFEFLNLLLHPFLERITGHSPALMLLALVCIAALLVPLHHRVEKLATAKLVEKNKQIRLAAAKKTIEKLSTPGNL